MGARVLVCLLERWEPMNAVTLKEAKLKLEQLVEKVIANAEPTIIVTESGEQVVFLPLEEYNSWRETLYLLSNPANAEHLRRSIAEAQAGLADSQNPNADRPYQPTQGSLEELLSFEATAEEEKILEDFDSFRRSIHSR